MIEFYFDYNATTPVDPEIFQAMEPWFCASFANPSSFHRPGQTAAAALKQARRQTAAFLGAAEDNEIIFTSGGTESNTMALRSVLRAPKNRHEIIISAVEHSSVRKMCQQLELEGYKIRTIGVDAQGQILMDELTQALSPETALVSIMLANNETGVIFPVEEIGKKIKSYHKEILFHVDAVQAVGKMDLDLKSSSIDYLSLSAHKFYGPKGVGALYARRGVSVQPLIYGGSQERGRRGGTENLPGIVGLGKACEKMEKNRTAEMERLKSLRDYFEKMLRDQIPEALVSGASSDRLANTSHVRFPGIEAETLLIALDQKGIYASSGSACMSGSRDPSHVLKAMGCSDEEARSGVRFSFGKQTSLESVTFLLTELAGLVKRLGAGIPPRLAGQLK